jgi:hypothetical protein
MQTPVFGYLWHFLVWQLCTYILPCVGVVVQGVEALFSFTVRGSLNPSVTSFMYRNHDTTPDADAEVGCYIAVGSEQFSQICCGPHYLSVCASEFSSSVCFSSFLEDFGKFISFASSQCLVRLADSVWCED